MLHEGFDLEAIASLEGPARVRALALVREMRRRSGAAPPARDWGVDDPVRIPHLVAPGSLTRPMSAEHREIWDWVSRIEPMKPIRPKVVVLPRGRGKSASLEMATVALGAFGRRTYAWYISSTQDQADDHLTAISAALETPWMADNFPGMADRAVGKYGHSKGWRVSRLRTASAFTVDAIGLDTASRGVKLEDTRPDFILFDDVDLHTDTMAATLKKLRTITMSIIPAGSEWAAYCYVQNLVLDTGIAARLCWPENFPEDEGFLLDRELIGPVPALIDPEYELRLDDHGTRRWIIIGGTPTWPEGQGIAELQYRLTNMSLRSFQREFQHATDPDPGGVFSHVQWRYIDPAELSWSSIVDTVVAVDPTVTSKKGSDSVGITCASVAETGHIYLHWSFEEICAPTQAIRQAVRVAWKHRASTVLLETNQGKDLWRTAWDRVRAELSNIADARKSGLIVLLRMLAEHQVLEALMDSSASKTLSAAVGAIRHQERQRDGKRIIEGALRTSGAKRWAGTLESMWRIGGAQLLSGLVELDELWTGEALPDEGWMPRLVMVSVAGQASKIDRAESMEPDYARGDIIHVRGDTHRVAERALFRFPLSEPDDWVDSMVHAWKWLRRMRGAPSAMETMTAKSASKWEMADSGLAIPAPKDGFRWSAG